MLDSTFLNTDLVILAGGKGSRIKSFLGKYPKPMVKINEKHFIQYIFNYSSKFNFKRIIILCGYRNEIFFKKFHNKIINSSRKIKFINLLVINFVRRLKAYLDKQDMLNIQDFYEVFFVT